MFSGRVITGGGWLIPACLWAHEVYHNARREGFIANHKTETTMGYSDHFIIIRGHNQKLVQKFVTKQQVWVDTQKRQWLERTGYG